MPQPMHFEGIGMCFWADATYKCPNPGDYFVSGAIPQAYRARQALSREYWTVTPTHYARSTVTYKKDSPVQFTLGGVPLPRQTALTEISDET